MDRAETLEKSHKMEMDKRPNPPGFAVETDGGWRGRGLCLSRLRGLSARAPSLELALKRRTGEHRAARIHPPARASLETDSFDFGKILGKI